MIADPVLHELQGRVVMAMLATLRGPRLDPPPWPVTEQDERDAQQLRAAERALNAYRPAAWDDAHP